MSHQISPAKAALNDHILAIGIHPEEFTPEELAPFNLTVEKLAAQIERSWAAIEAEGIVGEVLGVTKDPDEAEAALRTRFAERPFGAALVGSGVRLLPEHTVLFERIINVLIDLQPDIRLSFNTGPETMLDAIRRRRDR
jgi:hypothetical protein